MVTLFFKIKDVLVKYWMYILSALFLWVVFAWFFFDTEKKDNQKDFKNWLAWYESIFQITLQSGYIDLMQKARLLSIYLGTNISEPKNTEDEQRAIDLILTFRPNDFLAVEYAYKEYYTENRDLTADLHSFLSSSEYEEIAPILFP